MSENFGALCNDFHVNMRLDLKMDLPSGRETLLNLFDRLRKQFPAMDRLKRFSNELALESDVKDGSQQWIAVRRTSIRSGCVNPPSPKEAYALHKAALEFAPFFLSLSPLDVDYVELLYGFDLLSAGNHDQIVYDALLAGSPLAAMLSGGSSATPIDCQPVLGVALGDAQDVQAYFQIKTRTPPSQRAARGTRSFEARESEDGEVPPEPLSVYLTLRREGPIKDIKDLVVIFDKLSKHGEKLLESRVIPNMVIPIRDAIASNNS